MLGDKINYRNLLRAVIDLLPVIVQVRDRSGRYVLINQQSCRRFGKSAAEIMGRTNADFLPPREVKRVQAEDEQLLRLEKGVIKDERQLYIAATGQWGWFEVHKTPVSLEEGAEADHILTVLVDVTSLKERLLKAEHSKRRAEYNRDILALAVKATAETEDYPHGERDP